jgi:hypothetical protein
MMKKSNSKEGHCPQTLRISGPDNYKQKIRPRKVSIGGYCHLDRERFGFARLDSRRAERREAGEEKRRITSREDNAGDGEKYKGTACALALLRPGCLQLG